MIVAVIVHAIGPKAHVTRGPARRPGPDVFRAQSSVQLSCCRVVVSSVVHMRRVLSLRVRDEFEAPLGASNRCRACEGLVRAVMPR